MFRQLLSLGSAVGLEPKMELLSGLSEGVTGSSSTVGKTLEVVGMGDKRVVRNLSIVLILIIFVYDVTLST